MRDFDRTIISQYTSSPTLIKLIENLNDYLDPATNFEDFYNLIWNIDTAVGYGLDVWGRIVGVNRILKIADTKYFGFDEATVLSSEGFNVAPFYNGQPLTSNYRLDDASYRRLIFAKAALNITNCSIPAINQILLNLFPDRGNCYVAEGPFLPIPVTFGFQEAGDREGFDRAPFADLLVLTPGGMSMAYVFEFILTPFEIAIVQQSGVLPKPVGVKATSVFDL